MLSLVRPDARQMGLPVCDPPSAGA